MSYAATSSAMLGYNSRSNTFDGTEGIPNVLLTDESTDESPKWGQVSIFFTDLTKTPKCEAKLTTRPGLDPLKKAFCEHRLSYWSGIVLTRARDTGALKSIEKISRHRKGKGSGKHSDDKRCSSFQNFLKGHRTQTSEFEKHFEEMIEMRVYRQDEKDEYEAVPHTVTVDANTQENLGQRNKFLERSERESGSKEWKEYWQEAIRLNPAPEDTALSPTYGLWPGYNFGTVGESGDRDEQHEMEGDAPVYEEQHEMEGDAPVNEEKHEMEGHARPVW